MLVNDEDIAPPRLQLQDEYRQKQVNLVLQCLLFTGETIQNIREVFHDEMEKGIRSEPSSLMMENTYIPELPDGTEEGRYLALDLGGTNFRVLSVEFVHGQIEDVQVEHYEISEALRLGPGVDLFGHLAACVCDFLDKKNLQNENIPLGFTFSFPLKHRSLTSGDLASWTKSFNCSDVEGHDVVQLLHEGLRRKGCHNVTVHALLNDTTGTLMMGAFMDQKTRIGLILGTGSNACYLEKADKVKHWETERHGEREVIIDIEWGAFGDNGVLDFIRTKFDIQVDQNSLLVNSFTFEKYISGKYLGEVARVVLVHLVNEGLLFRGHLSDLLNTSDSFSTALISKIEASENVDDVREILEGLGIRQSTADDVAIVRHVCRVVSNRSALLVSTCLSVLLDRSDKDDITVAVDGSLFGRHPRFRTLMERYLALFTRKKFTLVQVSDGSGKGAGIVVAIAMKIEQRLGIS